MRSKRNNIIIVLILTIAFAGCFEKEEIVIPADINEVRIPYSLYEYQTYFRLADETIVSYNMYDEWDLGFESSDDGFSVILNPSRYMHAGDAMSTDFLSVNSNIADTMIFDDSSGDLGKAVLREWVDLDDPLHPVFSRKVYIIDRGLNEAGESFGFKKLVIEKMEVGVYYIRYANLDGSEEYTYQIAKRASVNFVLFSFDGGGNTITQQPASSDWDICFTKYSTVIPDNSGTPTPYIVRGVYINNIAGVKAVLDSVNSYYNIEYAMIPEYSFSSSQDIIGYDWKVYSDESYTLIDGMNFIVKNQDNLYFKIRFTDYFSETGQRGYPAFEQILMKK